MIVFMIPIYHSENAKQQQQKLASSNPAIFNLLNSSTASTVNNETNAVVVNAMNNTAVNQTFFTRNARVLNQTNLIALNARIQEQPGQQQSTQLQQQQLQQQLQQPQQQQQAQTIRIAPVNSANFTNFTSKRIVSTNSDSGSANNQTTLSALLVETPAADRPDIVCQNTNTLVLEKFSGASKNAFIQQSAKNVAVSNTAGSSTPHQFMIQQPSKANAILSTLSSPPPPSSNATVNVQGLNLAQLQSIQGLQVLAQPFSVLNVSSTGNIQGHPNLIVTLPVTSATQTSNAVVSSQAAQVVSGETSGQRIGSVSVNNIGVTPQTVVLANTGTSNLGELPHITIMYFLHFL